MRILASAALVATMSLCLAGLRPAVAWAQTSHPVAATLFDNHLEWQTNPSAFVTAELKHYNAGSWLSRASGVGLANASGLAQIELLSLDEAKPDDALLLPGDTLVLTAGSTPLTVTLPAELDAEIDTQADRVFGRAPAGAGLVISVDPDGTGAAALTRGLLVGQSQAFSLDLAGVADLRAAGTANVEYVDGDGHHWTVRAHGFEALATLGSNHVEGFGTAGRSVTVTMFAGSSPNPKIASSARIRGDGSWQVPGPNTAGGLAPLAAGDLVRFERMSGPDGSAVVEQTTPFLNIVLNAELNVVSGAGPAGAPLIVDLRGPNGEDETLPVTAQPSGAFYINLAGTAVIGPGWRAAVTYEAQDGIRFRSLATATALRIFLDSTAVTGVINPRGAVSATLYVGQTGIVKGYGQGMSDDDGAFDIDLHDAGGAEVLVGRGDRLLIAVAGAAPQSLTIPSISAQTFAASDTVSGKATAGGKVVVSYDGGPTPISKEAVAGPSGSFSVSFIGLLDIQPPMGGSVTVSSGDGIVYVTAWAAVALQIDYGRSTVSGNGVPGRVASVVLAAGGRSLAGASTRVPRPFGLDATPRWAVGLTDLTGTAMPLRAGDMLTVTVGDDVVAMALPELSATAQVATNQVTGRTAPGGALTIQVQRQVGEPSKIVPLTADGAGNFSHTFSGPSLYDLNYNDRLALVLASGPHTLRRDVLAPGLTLLLDLGQLVGVTRPNTPLLAELRGPSGLRSSITLRSDADGNFHGDFGFPDFPVTPDSGDTVMVRPLGGAAGETFSFTVPELTVSGDPNANVVQGRATPGGSLWIGAFDTFPQTKGFRYGVLTPALGGDGSYLDVFDNADYAVGPGTELSAVYFAASGHSASRTRYVATHSLLYAGDQVCGYVEPIQNVTANLLTSRAGSLGQGNTRSGLLSDYMLTLNPPPASTDPFVAAQVGNTLRVTAAGVQRDIPVPLLELQFSNDGTEVSGRGPTHAKLVLAQGQPGCFGSTHTSTVNVLAVDETGQAGVVNAPMPSLRPGEAIEVSAWDGQGYRVYYQYVEALVQIFTGTDRLAGLASPLAPVTVTVRNPLGNPKASATARAMGSGALEVHLPVQTFAAGDRVEVKVGAALASIDVDPLSLTSLPGADVEGEAPASRSIFIDFTLQDGRRFRVPWRVGVDGKVRFTAADVPPRASWSFSDVEGVRLVLPAAGGHEIIVEATRTLPTPTPIPTETPTPGPSPTNTVIPTITRTPTLTPRPSSTPTGTLGPGESTPTPGSGTPGGSATAVSSATPTGPTPVVSPTPSRRATVVTKRTIYLPSVVKKFAVK